MKRMSRDPLRFDAFELFAVYGGQRKSSLRATDSVENFVQLIRESVTNALGNPAMLHGQRTQAMFEGLVASLGSVKLLKHEDAGQVYAEQEVKVPDYRVVLHSGDQLLIEVKNFYQRDPDKSFILTDLYLRALADYASLMKADLKVAVYWSRWNIWTLVSLNAFTRTGGQAHLSLPAAVKANEMYILGDVLVGTKPPLCLELAVRDGEIHSDGTITGTTSGAELYCAGQRITDPTERSIALFLMLYGRWEAGEMLPSIEDGQVTGMKLCCNPREDTGQGFEMVGSLSEMFSRYYNWATVEGDTLTQVKLPVEPGVVGRLIPKEYKGQTLPLWRFHIRPASHAHKSKGRGPTSNVNSQGDNKKRRGT